MHPQSAISIAVLIYIMNAKIAQLVERDLAKVEVAGSNPVFRSLSFEIKLCFISNNGKVVYFFGKIKKYQLEVKRSDGECI